MGFVVRAGEREFRAPVLVVATGGLSIPKIGATDLGYRLARQFGLAIRDTRPGLVPVTFSEGDRKLFADLAGVSTEVIAAYDGQRFREKMLITHRGLSGPAILQISSYWKKEQAILLDLVPEAEVTASLLQSIRRERLPRYGRQCRRFSPTAWPIVGSIHIPPAHGPIPP